MKKFIGYCLVQLDDNIEDYGGWMLAVVIFWAITVFLSIIGIVVNDPFPMTGVEKWSELGPYFFWIMVVLIRFDLIAGAFGWICCKLGGFAESCVKEYERKDN